MAQKLTNLKQLLHLIIKAGGEEDRVTLGTIVEAVGSRSFGPLLLLVGVILTSPLSGIPGMATTMSVVVLTIAIQLIFGRKHFWLPHWLLKRSVTRDKLNKALNWLKPLASFIDRWVQPRLTVLVHRSGTLIIAIVCVIIAAGMPLMELVPFSVTSAGVILIVFGLSLVGHDGFLALLAFTFTAIILGVIIYNLF